MGEDDFEQFFQNAGGPTSEQAAFGFLAGSLKSMYDALQIEGFNAEQALTLTATYLNAEVSSAHGHRGEN